MLKNDKLRKIVLALLLALLLAVTATGMAVAVPNYNDTIDTLEPLLNKVAELEAADAQKAVSLVVSLNSAFFTGINGNQAALSNDEKASLDQKFRVTDAFLGNIFNNPSSGLVQFISSMPSGSEYGYNGLINAVQDKDTLYLAGLIKHIWEKSILPETKGWLTLNGIDFNELVLIMTALAQVEYEPGMAFTPAVEAQYSDILAGIAARSDVTPAIMAQCGLTIANFQEALSQLSETQKSDLEQILVKMNLIKPAAISFEPADGAEDVALDAPVKATFGTDVVAGDLSGVKIEINGTVLESVYAELSGREVIISHPDFSEDDLYTVVLPAGAVKTAEDGAGSIEYTWSFRTVDIDGPEVKTVEPADGATGVYLDADVKVTFDRDVIAGELDEVKVQVDGTNLDGTSAALSGRILTVEHPDFDYSKTYTVSLPAGLVKSAEQGTASDDYRWSFTTLGPETPVVVSVDPASGSTGVALDAAVSATFDRVVKAGDLDEVVIEVNGSVLEDVSATLSDTVLTLAHPDFNENMTYSVVLPEGVVESLDGNVSAAYRWSFETENSGVKPSVKSVKPAAGATGVALDAEVSATYDRDVIAGDLAGIKIMVDGAVMDNVSAELSGRELKLTHPGFNYDKQYTVILPGGVVTGKNGGLAAEAYQWSFATGDNPGPYVLDVKTNKTIYSSGENVLVSGTFKEIGEAPAPVAGVNIGLALSSKGEQMAFGQTTTNDSGEFSYTFLSGGLKAGNYTLDATANAASAQVYFSIGDETYDKPLVSVYNPAVGATGVAKDAAVSATFNMDVTASQADLAQITITKDGTGMSGVSASLSGRALTITHPDFERGLLTYTVNIPASVVKSVYNVYNDAVSWSFTTARITTGGGGGGGGSDKCSFKDVKDSHWAADVIKQLCRSGIVKGYPDGNFMPESNITRAEFAKIIVEAMDLEQVEPAKPTFKDVKPGAWFYRYVETAAKNNLVQGFETGEFKPNEKINREQICAILIRALDMEDEARASKDDKTDFADDQRISPWARGYVNAAVQDEAALIVGYPDHTFKPLNNATRAEACALIERFMKR